MEYAEIPKSERLKEGIGLGKGEKVDKVPVPGNDVPKDVQARSAAPVAHQGQTVPGTGQPIPPIPVYMDDDEVFVDFRKPGFWQYSPSVFATFFGLFLLILFTAGGQIVGFIFGAIILGAMMWVVRSRLWARTGYWFTNHKIVIHDGSKIRLVPYDEIALSSLAFEGENCMFSTVYDHEIVLKGIVDMDQVVAYISRRVKEERKRTNGEAR